MREGGREGERREEGAKSPPPTGRTTGFPRLPPAVTRPRTSERGTAAIHLPYLGVGRLGDVAVTLLALPHVALVVDHRREPLRS
jgi:hypothetical protein